MDPYELYAVGLLCLAGCDPNAGVTATTLAAALGIELCQEDAYGGAVQAGLVFRGETPTLWTSSHLEPPRRHLLQLRVIAQWYLQRLGLRESTAAEAAVGVGAVLLRPPGSVCDLWRTVERETLCAFIDQCVRQDAPSALMAARSSSFPPSERETQPGDPADLDSGPISKLKRAAGRIMRLI